MKIGDLTENLKEMQRRAEQLPLQVEQQARTVAYERLPRGTSLTMSHTTHGIKFTAKGQHAAAVAKNAAVRTRRVAVDLFKAVKL
jgi:hypothetical protein